MDRSAENLRVWQLARLFVNEVYDLMQTNMDYGFRDQIQRAAVSIMNNIAEGCDSGSDAKYISFLHIARGSCSEVRSMLYLCLDRHYCTPEQFSVLLEHSRSLSDQLSRLIQSLKRQRSASAP